MVYLSLFQTVATFGYMNHTSSYVNLTGMQLRYWCGWYCIDQNVSDVQTQA